MKKLVITKTPFRLCLTGGTDFFPFVKKHGGSSFSATIDKFATVIVSQRADSLITLSYPDGYEAVNSIEEIKHKIIRQALKNHQIKSGIDIHSFSDIPPGSGLGSSGAFTVGLLNALHALRGPKKSPKELAEEAAHLEIDQLKAPIGKHDQYMAACGGFLHLVYKKDNCVQVNKIKISKSLQEKMQKHFVLVFSGIKRSASEILSATARRFENSPVIFSDMRKFRDLGDEMRTLLTEENLPEFSRKMPELLAQKKRTFVTASNEKLDAFIETGYKAGAAGAKITGAGGGGFVYFYVPEKNLKKFKKEISRFGGTVYPYSFVDSGSEIIFSL